MVCVVRHVVGQRIVSDISLVCSCWSICSVCSESILICDYACSLLYLECLFCFTYQTYFDPQHGGVYLVTINR